ncbi:MAG: NAD(P)(+) transhydrogenase (Re/Si-specific) subunit beta, partial [Halobacteriovoraceae bacterium]|nr:NAD(P)(+) transhydrogenase (Re/Si-specific) subunit beta [Halobacteriovoraceae bacterium]
MNTHTIDLCYIFSACLFILGLKMLGHPSSARKGNLISSLGMLLAIIVTLFDKEILSYQWILTGMSVGIILGAIMARSIAMTSMPEMVAFFNGLGGAASVLVGWEIYMRGEDIYTLQATVISLSVLIGAMTFSGSLIAWAKLNGTMVGRPIIFPLQQAINILIFLCILISAGIFINNPVQGDYFYFLMGFSFLIGILSVLPIGGADMPVVISLLNSYSGIAAAMA